MTNKLDEEIRSALLPGAPDPTTRAAWARTALERAPARRTRRLRPLWPGLAAAVLLTLYFWPGKEEPKPAPPVHADEPETDEAGRRLKSTSVAEQRVANTAFLEAADKRESQPELRKGGWVIVVGGDSMHAARSLEDALAWADKLYPEAKHRFLFPIINDGMSRGDVIVDRSPVSLATVGSWFFQNAGVESKGRKKLTLDVGGKAVAVRVDSKSMAPLILPAGTQFPRFEIPGRMILEDMDRSWRSFRRYYVRVRCKDPAFDEWMEVVGAESADRYAPGNWLAVRFGGHVFHALRRPPAEQAAKEGKPLLVLRYREGTTDVLQKLFTGLEIEGFAQLAVPRAKRTVLQRYDGKGKLVAELLLPDASATTRAKVRAFLR